MAHVCGRCGQANDFYLTKDVVFPLACIWAGSCLALKFRPFNATTMACEPNKLAGTSGSALRPHASGIREKGGEGAFDEGVASVFIRLDAGLL